MLGLGLWWFEWASKNDNLCVMNLFLHLGVREILVNNDSLNELGVLDGSASLCDNLDKVEVDILAFKICNVKH